MKVLKNLKQKSEILLVIGIVSFSTLMLFTGALDKIENTMYDTLLRLKTDIPLHKDVLIVDVDDISIEEIGAWPWTRDIPANALLRMRELGAAYAVFDIEYLQPSQKGVNPEAISDIPGMFASAGKTAEESISQLAEAIQGGYLPVEYIGEAAGDLSVDVSSSINGLYSQIEQNLLRDNDRYLSQALHFFGNAFLTVNVLAVNRNVSAEHMQFTRDNFFDFDISDPDNIVYTSSRIWEHETNTKKEQLGIAPAMLELLQNAAGAGFTNVVIDADGVRRRIELFHEYNGDYIPQLAVSPLLHYLDTNCVEYTKTHTIIRDARQPGSDVRKDIAIPLDSNGRMLLNWRKGTYAESLRRSSFYHLYELDLLEENIVKCLKILEPLAFFDSEGQLLDACRQIKDDVLFYAQLRTDRTALLEGSSEAYEQYFANRTAFFTAVSQLFDGGCRESIMNELLLLGNQDESFSAVAAEIQNVFEVIAQDCSRYIETSAHLRTEYNGAFCLIGYSGVATTDLGTTPFDPKYANVGTHANVFNTIINGEFITPVPAWISVCFFSLLLMVWLFFFRNKSAARQNLTGAAVILLCPLLCILAMIWRRLYIPVTVPLVTSVLCYLSSVIIRFMSAERDKRFLRQAFSTYLSSDVVDEIVSDPTKLSLGGEEMNLTALFTDIKNFSGFSEKVTPEQLVQILNEYLTVLSNIILENKGTLDKYIGDAIVSFFGAPTRISDHAFRACLSAVRMKQAEKIFNQKALAEKRIPSPLLTRIGINTGKMVVGNMGTDLKMNYTIMGNDVNMASRLEGVNKVYHSWILVSEATWNEADSGIHHGTLVARQLDKVRVVGIDKPVQLYGIVGLKIELSPDQLESIATFHRALDLYLEQRFVDAEKLFMAASALFPEDEAAAVFAGRCRHFITQGIPDGWDGIVNMTSK